MTNFQITDATGVATFFSASALDGNEDYVDV